MFHTPTNEWQLMVCVCVALIIGSEGMCRVRAILDMLQRKLIRKIRTLIVYTLKIVMSVCIQGNDS